LSPLAAHTRTRRFRPVSKWSEPVLRLRFPFHTSHSIRCTSSAAALEQGTHVVQESHRLSSCAGLVRYGGRIGRTVRAARVAIVRPVRHEVAWLGARAADDEALRAHDERPSSAHAWHRGEALAWLHHPPSHSRSRARARAAAGLSSRTTADA